MPKRRKIDVENPISAFSAHRYWSRALDAGNDPVIDPEAARLELDSMVTITPAAMAAWLQKYPTTSGWRRYQAARRQREYSRKELAKISLKRDTAARLRRLARTHELSIDAMITRLMDGVTS